MSSQIKNLKPRTNKEKIKHLGVLFFSLFLTLAVFSQISAANPKPTYDVGLNKADWLYYKSNNDITAYLGKKSSNLPTVRYQKGADHLEFSMTGVSSTTSVSLETNVKTPNTPTLFYRNIFDGADANYQITNIPFRVKEEILLKETFPTSLVGKGADLKFIFSAETSAKPVKQSDGSIAFFDGKGDYLFQLDKPFMVDGKGNRSEDVSIDITPVRKIKSPQRNNGFNFKFLNSNFESIFNNLILKHLNIQPFIQNSKLKIENYQPQHYIITLSADSNWLSTAAYPVIIDPTVTHNADANFTGQMNRIADSDTTSSTQLESSYPEATKDPHTVLLLHFNEASGTQTGIRDYASTTRVITANANASTTNYVTQLGLGNSAAFDGTGDYLSAPASSDWAFGTGDFSVDFWVMPNVSQTWKALVSNRDGANNNVWKIGLGYASANKIDFHSGAVEVLNGNTTLTTSTWNHVAVIRSNGFIYLFINGVLDSSVSNSYNFSTSNTLGIGYDGTYNTASAQPPNAYLDSLRILKGRALTPEEIKVSASRRPYAVYTSSVLDASASVQWDTLNWTEGGVGTGDGETLYNSSGLVAQWNFNETSGTTADNAEGTAALDGTLTNFSYTSSQDQATTTTGWTANNKKWGGGSLMFDGSNDYVSVPDSESWNFGSGDFTIEGWINFPDCAVFCGDIVNTTNGGGGVQNMRFFIESKKIKITLKDSVGGTMIDSYLQSDYMPINTWHHVAFVRSGSNMIGFVDGIRKSTVALSGNGTIANSSNPLDIGRSGDSNFSGIIDSLRIYKGRALSAAEILSNYNAGNIEIQTRTGATSDPNDGSWGEWKPTNEETQLLSMDSDAANWRSDIMASTTIATSTETTLKMEGTGSLKVKMGMASTTAGTVALWHFEETGTTTGTYLYDETANNNDATTAGTTVVDGIFGKARKFNGTSDYVTTPNSTDWDFGTSNFSIDFWVYNTDLTKDSAIAGNWDTGGSRWEVILVGASLDDVIRFQFHDGAGPFQSIDSNTKQLISNNWQHIAIVRDGNNLRIFNNGIQISSGDVTGDSIDIGSTGNFYIGDRSTGSNALNGYLDSLRILKGRALSADEIAETYRMGANHHLTRQVSATDLSSANKLAFNVASDRPGTYLEAMLGESDYANYELASSTLALSTNTVLYIKGDEIASSTSIKDSSFSGKAITANGNARTSGNGKIGNSVYFDGTGDYLSLADSGDFNFGSGDFTIDFWTKPPSISVDSKVFFNKSTGNFAGYQLQYNGGSGKLAFYEQDGGGWGTSSASMDAITANTWNHVALTQSSGVITYFINGHSSGGFTASSAIDGSATNFDIGRWSINGAYSYDGWLDEFRIIKGTALTPDQIRQAYEYGLRTHPITIDFGATLQTSDLISNSTDYNFNITATTSGLSATTSGLYLGDKIIIKENLGGTEYSAQGTVNAINTTTGAITVPSWDTGSTFPASNGYSPNATVFKWQREYFDLTGAATTTRNAITNLTLRPTNGAEGRTVYLDDFRYNTNYLTASSSSAITSSNNRYLQYRAVFSSWDSFVSPYLSAISTVYTSLATMFPPAIGISGGGFLSF